ncbi:hypothetical protein EVG20_g1511 [Dentipellis fragilis]|uniref:Uncharacterized protein n=1 Tax=Dentipellis fragilis TaxID=205917 RepID=A0A4Y9ZAK9_9AGAM|nr:hypothetical protein EVG20_g1511 [Dentipellis fragilis]
MPPTVYYPLPWLEGTFSSRNRTDSLLRPELENGTITLHDFNAAVDFYPRSHRYWPVRAMTRLPASSRPDAPRRLPLPLDRRPKVNLGRWGALGMFSSFTGLVVGQIKRAQAHRDFVASLENRTGFFRALENVNVRTGGRTPLGLPIEDSHDSKHASAPAPASSPRRVPPIPTVDQPAPEAFSETWREDGRNAPREPPVPEPSEPAAEAREDHPRSRWDEIRIANTRGTQQTSWDKLRQGRPPAPRATVQKVEEQAPASAPAEDESERAREQAKFDAMMEAERRIAEKSSPSDAWK